MTLLLRVVLSSREARRVQLSEVPASVGQLIDILKERLELAGDFSLQFEDPEFGNALCNLTAISELPAERAVLHIMWNCDSSPLNQSTASVSSASVSSQDTISVHSEDFRPSWTDAIQMNLRHVSEWPCPFSIPKFSHDVELKLCKANVTYEKSKKGLGVTRDMKMEILDKIAEAVFEIKAYPEKEELESVLSAMVLKYPCLKEPGSITGYEGWTASIKHKLGNYRSKLRRAGCNEVNVNRKRKGGDEASKVSHVPDYPQHHDDSTLKEEKVALVNEMKKKQKNMTVIQQRMVLTFSLRRREVMECQPMVFNSIQFNFIYIAPNHNKSRLKALYIISEEFLQITSKDFLGTFDASLDKFVPGLLKLYRSKKRALGEEMEDLLDKLDEQTSDIVSHRKTAALRGLPNFPRDATEVFLKCLYVCARTCSCVEGDIVLHNIPDLSTALAYLFGLVYALNIDYPKQMSYTFEATQAIFFELGGSQCSQRIRSLRTKLLL
ncbi:beta-galactoside alpha-2,6-sialyltransferase (sialyltransferase 2) [Sarotherodon galilaeus]